MHDDPYADNSLDTATDELSRGYQKEKNGARRALHDAEGAVSQKAGEIASEAKDALLDQAADKQKDLGASLEAFGGALRAASDHLANSDQRRAASMILEAAGGLERLSTSLRSKPIEEVLGDLRSYGRNNTPALMVGSVVAGLALGRFLKSSSAKRSELKRGLRWRLGRGRSLSRIWKVDLWWRLRGVFLGQKGSGR